MCFENNATYKEMHAQKLKKHVFSWEGCLFLGLRPAKELAILFNKVYQTGLHILQKTVHCASKNMFAN